MTGAISGNLELLDFDLGGEAFQSWAQKVEVAMPGLLDRLVIETSQSGGRHVVYRCTTPIGGNMKLAQRDNGGRPITLIETRGDGGLFLCSPTPGYELTQGELTSLPVLTENEREVLLSAAWELNEYWPTTPQVAPCGDAIETLDSDRPGDDFNTRGDVVALLKKHGWTPSGARSDGNVHWTRPGKSNGTSATMKDRTFYVFSSNAHPFDPNKPYSPFAVFAKLEHSGDFEAAAYALGQQGYGSTMSEAITNVDISAIADIAKEPTRNVDDPGPLPEESLRIPFLYKNNSNCKSAETKHETLTSVNRDCQF